MAFAKMILRFPDGSSAELVAGTRADGPDALDECVRRVAVLHRVWASEDDDTDGAQ